jgi:hypothetical protein
LDPAIAPTDPEQDRAGRASTGAYFLANDRYIEWAVAFLESIRAWNPELPLRLIPFDDRADRVARLAGRYDFDVLDDPAFSHLDDLGREMLQGRGSLGANAHRKLASFWGPFESFAVLDVDVIVTVDLTRVLDPLAAGEPRILHCHTCELEAVYTSPELRGEARAAGYAQGINAGIWAARRGMLGEQQLTALADEARPHLSGIVPAGDQGFFNWAIHRRCLPVASFESVTGLYGWLWAGDSFDVVLDTDCGRPYLVAPQVGVGVRITHWAGFGLSARMPYRNLWRAYRWPRRGLRARARRTLDRAVGAVDRAAIRRRHA